MAGGDLVLLEFVYHILRVPQRNRRKAVVVVVVEGRLAQKNETVHGPA